MKANPFSRAPLYGFVYCLAGIGAGFGANAVGGWLSLPIWLVAVLLFVGGLWTALFMGFARKQLAKATFSQRDDGTVQVEIRTNRPLGPFVGNHNVLYLPEDYLAFPNAVRFGVSGPTRDGWRYLSVMAQAPEDLLVDRHLDLSEGSHERAMAEALIGQREVPIVWVNEGIETLHQRPERESDENWRQVLENTRGITAEAWQDEIEEMLWRESESWRPGPRPRKHRRRTAAPPDRAPVPCSVRPRRPRMTSPVENVTVRCPGCGHVYEDWWRASLNLALDPWIDGDYIRQATTATCPECGQEVVFDTLIVDGDGIWGV